MLPTLVSNQPQLHYNYNSSNKQISSLQSLIKNSNKTQSIYQAIDQIFTRLHLSFFQNIRNFLPKQQYHQLIDKCSILQLTQNKVISKKSVEDSLYYVLLDGVVSFNQQRILPNILTGQQQIQYTQIYHPQKGQLLNAQTTNSPKHNIYTTLSHTIVSFITFNVQQTYTKFLKKYLLKQLQEKSYSLSHTSLFKGITSLNIKKLLPYFSQKNFYKYNQIIYRQEEISDFVFWILEGEVELIKEDLFAVDGENENRTLHGDVHNRENRINDLSHLNMNSNNGANNILINRQQICKIVKLSKYQIFGIDQYVFKPGCRYLFTARVCSQSLKTICIPYKSLLYIQSSYPCINQNIDFYLKRASAMHSKIVQKNFKIMENKENINLVGNIQKKKNKKKNKKKKKNPATLEWWGLAQNTVGNKKYKLQLPKFIQNTNPSSNIQTISPKSQPMFQSPNSRLTKIQQFKRKIFQQQIDEMIQNSENQQNTSQRQSPYKIDYVPKLNKLKVKMLDVRPKAIDMTQKVKKKLLSYAKNGGSFCDKLNLE